MKDRIIFNFAFHLAPPDTNQTTALWCEGVQYTCGVYSPNTDADGDKDGTFGCISFIFEPGCGTSSNHEEYTVADEETARKSLIEKAVPLILKFHSDTLPTAIEPRY